MTSGKRRGLTSNEEMVIGIEKAKNILPEARNKIFRDVYGVKFKNATTAQIRAYRSYLLVEKDYNSTNTSVLSYYKPSISFKTLYTSVIQKGSPISGSLAKCFLNAAFAASIVSNLDTSARPTAS